MRRSGRSLRLTAGAIIIWMIAGARAFAGDLIFPGIHPKLGAGAGQTISRGATAVFYNPANMIFSKFIEPFVDVSFAKVTYTYTHTDTETFTPVTIPVTTPALTVGMTMRPIDMLSLGVAFYPTGSGKVQTINAVPLPLYNATDDAFNYTELDLLSKQSGYRLGVGGAFRLDFPIAVGGGLIRSSENNQIVTLLPLGEDDDPETEREPLLDAQWGGAYNQFIGGIRSELFDRTIAIALSYKTSVVKTFTGDIARQGDAEYAAITAVGYNPAVIGAGLEGRFGAFGVYVDYTREMWSKGRLIYKRGLGADPEEVDFKDTNNICGGIKFWVAPKHMLTAAFGSHGANVGFGTDLAEEEEAELRARAVDAQKKGGNVALKGALQDEEEEEEIVYDPYIGGVTFGALENIPRTIFAGGYRAKIQGNGYLELGVQYTKGSRVVPEGSQSEGLYSLNVILVSAGLGFGF